MFDLQETFIKRIYNACYRKHFDIFKFETL